ncbi:MAG TPA: TIGR03086 family metal-binding protein [Actinomycetota bacterium]|jgi:uncharacterized protein (TIGR03086 family)|nr:TIGR03086 family metal-binding protein [Actinomycetota bacterium]
MDLLDLFDRATAWTATKVAGAQGQLDADTPCREWSVRTLMDHLLWGQRMFASGPSGGTIAPPSGPPPSLIGDDPAAEYEDARKVTLHAYSQPGVLEGMVKGSDGDRPAAQMLGIAFCDQLVHGWDLAKATGQDTTMPAGLASAAFMMLNGRVPDDARGPGKNFMPAIAVADDASDQDKLIAYCGRQP